MYSKGFKFALRRRLGLRADAIVANSEGGLAYWRAAGYTGPCHVIRNMTEVPPSGGTERSVANRFPKLLAIGRLSEEKNYPQLLDALEIVFKRLPAARATILGEGPARSQIEARIAYSATLAGRVDLPGHVSDVADRLAQAAVFVSLSRFEGTPNTVIEAMVNGCPLVVSDIPAHRELLSAEEARIVPLDSPDVIAEALFVQLTDAGTAHRQAMLARDRVGDWSTARIADQYIAVYNSLR
jgi:glycosyltransferase involved in cell wall biosynthesis